MESKDSSEKVLKSMQAILALIAKDLSPSGAEKAKKIAADLDEVEKRIKKARQTRTLPPIHLQKMKSRNKKARKFLAFLFFLIGLSVLLGVDTELGDKCLVERLVGAVSNGFNNILHAHRSGAKKKRGMLHSRGDELFLEAHAVMLF